MWKEYNPNPAARNVGDCSVRAITKALDMDWEKAFLTLVRNAFSMCDMPSADAVWGSVLRQHGFNKYIVPNTCPDCYTIEQFARDHQTGAYVVGTGGHVVTIIDGDWYDSWNSGHEIAIYYWHKPKEEQTDGMEL